MDLATIDVDQHLFETRDTWSARIDPAWRDDALEIVDDERGWPWLAFRGEHLYPVEVQHPGHADDIGKDRLAMRRGDPSPGRYEDLLPDDYARPRARLEALDRFGIDAAVLFPNFGLLWEEMLAVAPDARRANASAYNRWSSEVAADGAGRLFPVAHLLLDDVAWACDEVASMGRAGVRLAMTAPAPVGGRPLSHRDFDPVWAACCEHGVTPVFHVAGFPSPLDPAWHDGDPEPGDRLLDSVFLQVAPAVAIANMIVHGTFARFPELRLGVVELTAGWVPSFLLQLDGAFAFYVARHGEPFVALDRQPSAYFLDQVRVAALPYEAPARLVGHVGPDTFMVGSDWPHAEGVADPLAAANQATAGLDDDIRAKLLGANAAWLLRL